MVARPLQPEFERLPVNGECDTEAGERLCKGQACEGCAGCRMRLGHDGGDMRLPVCLNRLNDEFQALLRSCQRKLVFARDV